MPIRALWRPWSASPPSRGAFAAPLQRSPGAVSVRADPVAGLACALPNEYRSRSRRDPIKARVADGFTGSRGCPPLPREITWPMELHGASHTIPFRFSSNATVTASCRCYAGFRHFPSRDLRPCIKPSAETDRSYWSSPSRAEAGIIVPPSGLRSGVRRLCYPIA